MKIHFIYRKYGGAFKAIIESITYINSFAEAYKLDRNSIDQKTFNYIQALTLNKDFVEDVKKIRQQCSIPDEGYDFLTKDEAKKYDLQNKTIPNLRSGIDDKLIKRLKEDYEIPNMLYSSLKDIVLMNIVNLPLPKLVLDRPYKGFEEINPYAIKIVINSKISKTDVHNFIDSNWIEIEKALEVQKNSEFYVSERDMRVISMRVDDKLKFPEIADKLNELDESEVVNEDSIKTAFHKARKSINSLKKGK